MFSTSCDYLWRVRSLESGLWNCDTLKTVQHVQWTKICITSNFLCSLWFPWWKEEKADFHVLFYFGSLGHQRMEQSHVCSGYRTFNMEPTTDKGGFKLSTFICVAWIFKLLWSTVCVCVITVWNVFYPGPSCSKLG